MGVVGTASFQHAPIDWNRTRLHTTPFGSESTKMSNTKTIARNTGWYGLESIITAVVTLVTSIAIARTLGPSKMGYIIYIVWVASVVARSEERRVGKECRSR